MKSKKSSSETSISSPRVETTTDDWQGRNRLNSIEKIQQDYTKNVVNKLENVRKIMINLNPLNQRLEILENLYSLIYLSAQDLKEIEDQYSDEEEAEQQHVSNNDSLNKTTRNDSIRSEYEIINTTELGIRFNLKQMFY